MIAFTLVDDFSNLVFEVESETINAALEAEIITWAEECIRRRTRDAGEGLTLDASCREEDVERLAFLERHGFITQPIRSLHLKRSLNDPIPEPILPDGFEIRPSTGSEEVLASAQGRGTPQEVADFRENSVQAFIRRFYPSSYVVSKGKVTDVDGNQSNSIDCLTP